MTKVLDKKILICDNRSSRRDTLASRFRLQGYSVELSGSGFQALSMIEKDIYDVLLIIESTEDMPGHELLNLSRGVYKKDELPIIFVGRNLPQNQILEFFQAGANDYLEYSDKIFGSLLEKISQLKRPKLKMPKKGMMQKNIN